MKLLLQITLTGTLLLSSATAHSLTTKERLGKALFQDKTLSKNRKMSCATCHHIKSAFIDIRRSPIGHMAAQSANKRAIGDRNVPTASYAAYIPEFQSTTINGKPAYLGGQFLDGRANDLTEQAKGPFLNPIEMQMPNKKSVVKRVRAKRKYRRAFRKFYGQDIFSNVEESYDAIADAIASFEKTKSFSPFNSRYDRFLKGNLNLKRDELRGMELFSTKGKCTTCHTLTEKEGHPLFTNFTYHNLGVPVNTKLRALNGKSKEFIDHGLLDNPEVDDITQDGKFRTSTLRNIAVTAPYMHNGIFKELKTVVHFYNTRDVEGAINPETGEPWRKPEVTANMNKKLLGNLGLTDREEDNIVAFLKTLSDRRYSHHKTTTSHGNHHANNHGHNNIQCNNSCGKVGISSPFGFLGINLNFLSFPNNCLNLCGKD